MSRSRLQRGRGHGRRRRYGSRRRSRVTATGGNGEGGKEYGCGREQPGPGVVRGYGGSPLCEQARAGQDRGWERGMANGGCMGDERGANG